MVDDVEASPEEFELSKEAKHRITTSMLEFSLRLLLAEVGRMQGPPQKAQAFIDNFKAELYRFSSYVNSEQTPIDKAWDKEMRKFVDDLIAGISFKEGEP